MTPCSRTCCRSIVVVLLWKWLLTRHLRPGELRPPGARAHPGPGRCGWAPAGSCPRRSSSRSWQFFPFVVISLLARLQTIDLQLYEAAAMDGAGAWRRFMHVTLPELPPRAVRRRSSCGRFFMFTKFDVPWLMAAGGGSQERVQTLPIYAFRKTFGYFQAGEGAAISVSLFLLLACSCPSSTSAPTGARRRPDDAAAPADTPRSTSARRGSRRLRGAATLDALHSAQAGRRSPHLPAPGHSGTTRWRTSRSASYSKTGFPVYLRNSLGIATGDGGGQHCRRHPRRL